MTVYPRLIVGDCIRGSFYHLSPQQPGWESYREKTPLKKKIWTLLEMQKAQAVYVQQLKAKGKCKHVFTSNSVSSHCRQVD